MARQRVEMPTTFEEEVRSAQDSDGAIWTNFKVLELREITGRENRDGTPMFVRDCSWGFAGKDENGDFLKDAEGHVQWYTIKVTLWNKKAREVGDILAQLFAFDSMDKGARCRIIFEPKACYGELGNNDRVWYKHEDPDKYQIYLSRPMKSKCTREQNLLWDALEAKAKAQGLKHTQWINLYDGEPINPFQETEMMEQDARERERQQAVPVGAGSEEDDDLGL